MVEADNLELKDDELRDYFGINEEELREVMGNEESRMLDLQLPVGLEPTLLDPNVQESPFSQSVDKTEGLQIDLKGEEEEKKRSNFSELKSPKARSHKNLASYQAAEASAGKVSLGDTVSLNSISSGALRPALKSQASSGKSLNLTISNIYFRELNIEDLFHTLSQKSEYPQKTDVGNDNVTFVDISQWHKKLRSLDEKQLYDDMMKKKVWGVGCYHKLPAGPDTKSTVVRRQMNTVKGTVTSERSIIVGILLLKLETELSELQLGEFSAEISPGVNLEKTPLMQVVLAGVIAQCQSAGIGTLLFQKAMKVIHIRYATCMLVYAVCKTPAQQPSTPESTEEEKWAQEFETFLIRNHFRLFHPDGESKVFYFPLEQMVKTENKKAAKYLMASIFLCKNPFEKKTDPETRAEEGGGSLFGSHPPA